MEKDKCVICSSETIHDKNTNIDFRSHYVEGAGQLCPKCHDDINKKSHK